MSFSASALYFFHFPTNAISNTNEKLTELLVVANPLETILHVLSTFDTRFSIFPS